VNGRAVRSFVRLARRRWRESSLALVAVLALSCGCGGGGSQHSSGADRARAAGTDRTQAALPGAHRASREAVPVLMYHVIDRAPPGTPLPALWVSRAEFDAQMRFLASRGYHAVTLAQVWTAWHRSGLLPSKPIVISFDDGYRSQYTNALPILRSHHWPGVLNLEVATLHTGLRPAFVRAMISAGWEIDAHTMTHPDLTSVGARELRYEVAGSRAYIRRRFRVPVSFFCYPAGRFDRRVIAAVRAAGYRAATTTDFGLAAPTEPPYELRRIRINAGDGVSGLRSALAGAAAGAKPARASGE
jgi:peptidoglycan/xylan/chitin deacetylase (PgdA/CDA1 family)